MLHSIRLVGSAALVIALGAAQDRHLSERAGMDETSNPAAMVVRGNVNTLDDSAIAYWTEKLRGGYAKDSEEIRKTIHLLRYRPRQTERAELNQAANDLRDTLGLWQSR